MLKATSELSENLFSGETEAWSDWHPYIFIIITFSGAAFQVCPAPIGCTYRSCGITWAVLQLSCLNKGLALSGDRQTNIRATEATSWYNTSFADSSITLDY